MKSADPNRIEGVFQHLIYAPKGEIEGLLLDVGGQPVQVTIDKHDADAARAAGALAAGQAVALRAAPQPPSAKGAAEHPVHAFEALLAVDGRKPVKSRAAAGAAFRGTVVRLNHARHGAANGVILDSGDFIHTRPDGMQRLKLKVGDSVRADGDAHRLADDTGWAVEAVHVNGKALA